MKSPSKPSGASATKCATSQLGALVPRVSLGTLEFGHSKEMLSILKGLLLKAQGWREPRYPGKTTEPANLEKVASGAGITHQETDATPVGVEACNIGSQGSSFLATLGFKLVPRWGTGSPLGNGFPESLWEAAQRKL
jgi:hypothetical protein